MTKSRARILVFAHGLVGRACLKWLLERKYDIVGVVTHPDNAHDSVQQFCATHKLLVFTPATPNTLDFIEVSKSVAPDIILSFYYRSLICDDILAVPRLGGFNIHGSLLPDYRGCCPANWALIHGESTSGATLHKMVKKADAGEIVGQAPFPISPNDNALDVTYKIRNAALTLLETHLDSLLDQTAGLHPQDLSVGRYFKRRTAQDAQIDWSKSPWEIHNLIRSQAPVPHYFGASGVIDGQTYTILKSEIAGEFIRKSAPDLPGSPLDCPPGTVLSHLSSTQKRIACGTNQHGKSVGFLDVTLLPSPTQSPLESTAS